MHTPRIFWSSDNLRHLIPFGLSGFPNSSRALHCAYHPLGLRVSRSSLLPMSLPLRVIESWLMEGRNYLPFAMKNISPQLHWVLLPLFLYEVLISSVDPGIGVKEEGSRYSSSSVGFDNFQRCFGHGFLHWRWCCNRRQRAVNVVVMKRKMWWVV